MTPKLFWLFSFVALYWIYCLYWGFNGAKLSKTSADYFIAGRNIGIWVFVLAATGTNFSGWTFIGHLGKILSKRFEKTSKITISRSSTLSQNWPSWFIWFFDQFFRNPDTTHSSSASSKLHILLMIAQKSNLSAWRFFKI